MEKAIFTLKTYRFNRIDINLEGMPSNRDFNWKLEITPKGAYNKKEKKFFLIFDFVAKIDGVENFYIKINCTGLYMFNECLEFSCIPDYFYSNSIAILFPYIRAFIGTVTLQANIPAVILPTFNLSSLKEDLKNNTQQISE